MEYNASPEISKATLSGTLSIHMGTNNSLLFYTEKRKENKATRYVLRDITIDTKYAQNPTSYLYKDHLRLDRIRLEEK